MQCEGTRTMESRTVCYNKARLLMGLVLRGKLLVYWCCLDCYPSWGERKKYAVLWADEEIQRCTNINSE